MKSGIRIIRHMMPDPPDLSVSLNPDWHGLRLKNRVYQKNLPSKPLGFDLLEKTFDCPDRPQYDWWKLNKIEKGVQLSGCLDNLKKVYFG